MNGKQFFRNGVVEKGDTVYVLHRNMVACQACQAGPAQSNTYTIDPYIVTSVGQKYLSAKMGTDPKSPRRAERFEPIASIRPGCGLYLESTQFKNSIGAIWRDRLFLHRYSAETCMESLKRIDAELASKADES